MAQIGVTDRHKFYIVRKTNDPPVSDTAFINYSGRWVKWGIKGNVSQVQFFEGIIAGDVDPDDFKAGNLLYVMSGLVLLGKFEIDRPVYKNDHTIEVKGYQSTGSEMINRGILTETTHKIRYDQGLMQDILEGSSTPGILIDGSNNQIINLIGSFPSSRFDFSVDYDNRVMALNKFAKISQSEWLISHGTNDITPYNEGDQLTFTDRIGSSSSTYTFHLSGSSKNCSFSTGNDETDSLVNEVIIKGSDAYGNQVQSWVFDATARVTWLDGSLDGWLYEDMIGGWDCATFTSATGFFRLGEAIIGTTSGASMIIINIEGAVDTYSVSDISGTPVLGEVFTGQASSATADFDGWVAGLGANQFKVRKGHGISMGANNRHVKIDSEAIAIRSIISGGVNFDYFNIVNQAQDSAFGRGRPNIGTDAVPHRSGADVIDLGDVSLGLTVETDPNPIYAGFGVGDTVRIGNELIEIHSVTGSGTPTPGFFTVNFGDRFFADSYAHGDGIRCTVSTDHSRGVTYIPSNPDTSTTSSIRTYGIKSQTISELSAGTMDALDGKSQSIIENKENVIRIQLNIADYYDVWSNVALGDSVTINDPVGATNIISGDYRIMGFEYGFDYGAMALILYLNKNEIRTWALTEFTYPDAVDDADQNKRQEPSRGLDLARFINSMGAGDSQSRKYQAQLKNINDPTEPFDAVNKKYVDGLGGAGGGSYWLLGTVGTDEIIFPQLSRRHQWTLAAIDPAMGQSSAGQVYFNITSNTFRGYDGTAWADIGGAGSAFWQAGVGYIEPVNVGDDVFPNGIASLGSSIAEWNEVWTNEIRTVSSTTSWDTSNASDTTHRIRNIGAGDTILELSGDMNPTSNLTYNLGRSGYYWSNVRANTFYVDTEVRWNNTGTPSIKGSSTWGVRLYHAGSAIINAADTGIDCNRSVDISGGLQVSSYAWFSGDVQLGNAAGDDIEFYGRVATNIIPSADNLYDLGSSSHRWSDFYVVDIYLGDLVNFTDPVIAGTNAIYMSSGNNFNVEIGNDVVFQVRYGPPRKINVNGELDVDNTATFDGDVELDDDVTLGSSSADDIFVNGEFADDLIPASNGVYDLGDTGETWNNIYLDNRLYWESSGNTDYMKISSGSTFQLTLDGSTVFTVQDNGDAQCDGDFDVGNTLTKGAGSFDIPHPDPAKPGWRLRHSFVETPSGGGNLYKFRYHCIAGENTFELPDYFKHLNKDVMVWVNPFKHFGSAWGNVTGNKLMIMTEKEGEYNILIFGDRKDPIAINMFTKYGNEYKEADDNGRKNRARL